MTDATAAADRDYVLGTHDDEIARLGLQHTVWRPRALGAWQRAGFNVGQTIIDVGSGPGYATLDLAELVGATGRVIAVDRSRRFLDTLETRRRARGIDNVTVVESDLDDATFSASVANGAWCRWVLAFVQRPRDLLARVAGALQPGGAFVSHEYFEYASWRAVPRSPLFEEFVSATIANWRASGGEPDIGLEVPRWLEELGFEIESTRTLIDVISPRDYMWQWPKSFMEIGLKRLVTLGAIEVGKARMIEEELERVGNSPDMRMITPGVLEVIARKR
jgi:ubiquinone/menaquinone biosynthesis C-methylase UbiE